MSDFVDDYLSSIETKHNDRAPGANTTASVTGNDLNQLSTQDQSLRTAILGGKVHGLRNVTSAPSQLATTSQLYVLNNKLTLDNGTGTTPRQLTGPTFYAADYGTLDPTGQVSSVAAINAAILAASAFKGATDKGGVVRIGWGTFLLDDTILCPEAFGIAILGEGIQATIFRTTAALAAKPVFLFRNSSFCSIGNFTIYGLTANQPSVGIEMRNESGHSTGLSTKNHVFDVFIGDDTAELKKGVSMSGNVDGNNDYHVFERVQVYGATEADAAIDNTQSVGHSFLDCNFNGNAGPGKRGVWTAATRDRASDDAAISPAPGGGTFMWKGGSCGGHTICDFYIGGQGPGVNSVEDCGSEASYRFLDSAFLPGVFNHITLKNIRYASMTGYQAGDNIAFRWQFAGTFVLTESRFDQLGAGLFAKITLLAAEPSVYRVTENTWNQYGSFTTDCIKKIYSGPTGSYPGGQFMGVESNLYLASDDVTHWKGNVAEGIRYADTEGTFVEEGDGRLVVDFPSTLFSASASLTRTLKAFSIRAGYKLSSARLMVKTSFAGTTTLTAALGTSGTPTNVLLAADMKAAANTTYGLIDGDKGASFTRAAQVDGGYSPSMTADTQINLLFTATGTNLNTLTTGSVRLYVKLERLGD